MKRCEFCQHGLPQQDPTGAFYRICTLIPPQPSPETYISTREEDPLRGVPQLVTAWVRPSMALSGWCGQFKLSVKRYLFRDPRA